MFGKLDTTEKSAFLGAGLVAAYICLIMVYAFSRDFRRARGSVALLSITLITGGLYLMAPSSAWIWERVVYLRYFQFPFRLLTITTVAAVAGYGLLVEHFAQSKLAMTILTLSLVVPLWITKSHYQPLGYQYGTTYTVDDPCMTSTWADEYLSKWTKTCIKAKQPLLESDNSQTQITEVSETQKGRALQFMVDSPGEIIIGKYFAPEWKAYDDKGNELEIRPHSEYGIMSLRADHPGLVRVFLTKSKYSAIGDYVSLITLSILILTGISEIWMKLKRPGRATQKSK
jgi:hypothetical protein